MGQGHMAVWVDGENGYINVIVFCYISSRLSGSFAENNTKLAHYVKKLTRPVGFSFSTC